MTSSLPPGYILFVLPYEFYFEKTANRSGGLVAHTVGVVEAFVRKGYLVKVVADDPVPGLETGEGVSLIPLPLAALRKKNHCAIQAMLERDRECPGGAARRLFRFLRRAPRVLFRKMLYHAVLFTAVCREVRSETIEFVYCRHNSNAYVPALASALWNVSFVLEVNTPTCFARASGPGECSPSWNERLQYRLSSVISVVSPMLRDWLARHLFPSAMEKVVLNPNGVDPCRFRETVCRKDFRARYSIPENAVLLTMTANFQWYNDLPALARFFQSAREQFPDLYLFLVGEGEALERERETIRKEKLAEHVVFAGRVAFREIAGYLAVSDILVSYFDFKGGVPQNCSIKHLEYLAAGKPVLATEVAFVNYAVRNEENGLLIEPNDREAFVRSVLRLARDPGLRERLGRQGQKDALEHTWDRNADRVLEGLCGRARQQGVETGQP
jgi:glycosyltransferase involved in cell wall biosynthesis